MKPWVKYDSAAKTLTFYYGEKESLGDGEYLINEEGYRPDWYNVGTSVTKVVFDTSFAQARPTSCCKWFDIFTNLQNIEGIENLNTSEVKNMGRMFSGCSKLTSLDLSNFDTSNVTDMSYMFSNCFNLTSLDLSNFYTSNVTSMRYMFNCANLKAIYLGDGFDVDNLGNIDRLEMFGNSLPTLYTTPLQYEKFKKSSVIASYENTVKPYVSINPEAKYGTICVPVGSSLAKGSFTGFDKLYQVKNADTNKEVVTMEEAKMLEPGKPYVYHRYLEGKDFESKTEESAPESSDDASDNPSAAKAPVMSVITFDVDKDAASSVIAPVNEGSMLIGTFESIKAPGGSYILQKDGMFHLVQKGNPNNLPVGAYRAYLEFPGFDNTGDIEAKSFRMVFEGGEATGIDGINADDNANKGIYDAADQQPKVFFDLMGRKVSAPQKGAIYIVNGKKMIF